MGTDIHLQAEVRVAGAWSKLPNPNQGRCYFHDRNYALFGLLAGVRWTGLGTIASPRGLPPDISFTDEYEGDDGEYEAYERRGTDLGEHTQSWLTGRELYEWDWGQTYAEQIPVSVETYYNQLQFGRAFEEEPERLQFTAHHKKVDDMAMMVVIQHLKKEYAGQEFYKHLRARTEWTEIEYAYTHAQLAGKFYTRTMPSLFHASAGRLDDVRIVFGFDS